MLNELENITNQIKEFPEPYRGRVFLDCLYYLHRLGKLSTISLQTERVEKDGKIFNRIIIEEEGAIKHE